MTPRLLLLICLLNSHWAMAQNDQKFNVFTEQANGSVFVYASNQELFPQTLQLTLTLKGVKPKEPVPDFIIVPAENEKFLLAELVPPVNRSWSYKSNYLYFMGDVNARHDDDFVYRLPFQAGQQFKVEQGYNGSLSHAGTNALDFTMPEGTSVMAARGGTVVSIKEDSNYGCGQKSCADYGNYVRILHADGTFADYYHLQQNGALVAPGDEVKAGDEIGKSGNTGFSTGPHLHFIVYKREEKGRTSFKTLFKTKRSEGTLLDEKEVYGAVDKL